MVTSKSAGEVAFVMADMADSIMSVEEVIVVINNNTRVRVCCVGSKSSGVKIKRSHFKASKRKKIPVLGGTVHSTHRCGEDVVMIATMP